MPSPSQDLSFPVTITWETSTFTLFIDSVEWDGIRRGVREVPHFGIDVSSTVMANIPKLFGKLVSGGAIRIEGYFNGDAAPPITAPAEDVTVAWNDLDTDNTWQVEAGMTEFNIQAPLEEDGTGAMRFSAVIEVNGGNDVTIVAGVV